MKLTHEKSVKLFKNFLCFSLCNNPFSSRPEKYTKQYKHYFHKMYKLVNEGIITKSKGITPAHGKLVNEDANM